MYPPGLLSSHFLGCLLLRRWLLSTFLSTTVAKKQIVWKIPTWRTVKSRPLEPSGEGPSPTPPSVWETSVCSQDLTLFLS
jgi:hypothetical protein